ncbi:hypothetical protein PSY40_22890, partial [Shigella flexneri]|nr:hypothetical protein [Shigella flexneri]
VSARLARVSEVTGYWLLLPGQPWLGQLGLITQFSSLVAGDHAISYLTDLSTIQIALILHPVIQYVGITRV